MKRIVALVCMAVMFVSGSVMAEEGGVPLINFDAVVVTAQKYEKQLKDVPQSVTVITAEELKEKQGDTLPEILNDVAGIQVQPQGGTGSLSTVSMRGMKAPQVLVLVDGRRVNKFQDADVDLSLIPVTNIESIEIVRGAASSLYGSNAMGGVINIITKKEAENSVNVSYGSFNTAHSDVTISNRVDKLTYTLTASNDTSKGDRPNSEYSAKSASWYTGYEFGEDFDVALRMGYFGSELGTPGSVAWEDYDDTQFQTKYYADLEVNLPMGLMIKGYSNYDALKFQEDAAANTAKHKNYDTGSEARITRDLAAWNRLTVGAEYHDYRLVSSEIGNKSMHQTSGYVQDELKVSDIAVVTVGGRYDSYRGGESEISPSAAVLVYLPHDTSLRMSAGRSFRMPTFNDLYWPAGVWAQGNPNLDPEKGDSYDISIDSKISDALWVRVGGFYSDVKDMIIWAPGPAPGFVYSPYNVDNAFIRGLEAEVKAKLSKHVSMDLGYTLLDTKNKTTKEDVIYRPDQKLDVSIKVANDKSALILSAEHVGKRYHNDPSAFAPRIRLHEYTIVNAKLSHKVSEKTEFYVKGENLTDKDYNFNKDYPMPGLAVYAGMKVTF